MYKPIITGLILFLLTLANLLVFTSPSPAVGDSIRVMSISSQDESALIRNTEGKTQMVAAGDFLEPGCKITKITADSVFIEETIGNVTENIVIRLVGGRQRIERTSKPRAQSQPLTTTASPSAK